MDKLRKAVTDWFMASWWFIPPKPEAPEVPLPKPKPSVVHHSAPRRPLGARRGVFIRRM